MDKEFEKLIQKLHRVRAAFEMAVEGNCIEITELAKQISVAIGEISIDEAKEVIIREFSKKMREPIIVE